MKTYTAEQTAEVLMCHPRTVMELCKSGELPARKAGRRWVIAERNLEEFLCCTKKERSGIASSKRTGGPTTAPQRRVIENSRRILKPVSG